MRKLLISLLLVSSCLCAKAQQWGVAVGVTSSNTDVKSAWAQAKSVNQYHIGLTYNLPLILGFQLQPSVLYDVKGLSIEENLSGLNLASFDTKTGYLEGAVQLQWGLDVLGLVRAYALVEPYVAYALDSSVKGESSVSSSDGWESISDWEGINRFQYGAGIGVGADLFSRLQVSLRYYWDMGDLFQEDGTVQNEILRKVYDAVVDSKNSGIKLSVAFLF